MWVTILGWIMKSKGAKVGGGIIGGSGVVAMLMGFVNVKEESLRQYVDSKHEIAIEKVINIKDDVSEIKSDVKWLKNYLITKPKNGGE